MKCADHNLFRSQMGLRESVGLVVFSGYRDIAYRIFLGSDENNSGKKWRKCCTVKK